MSMNLRGLIVASLWILVGNIAVAAGPAAPSVYDPVPDSGAVDPALPPLPAPVAETLESPRPAGPPPVGEIMTANTTAAMRVNDRGGFPVVACPYCGDPNCPRVSRKATHSERIKSGLREHLCPGIPGHRLTPRPPAGSRLHAIMGWQRANGQAAQQVLYHYDFLADTARLNLHGQRRLHEIAVRAMRNGFPIIIQPTPRRPELEQGRWETVVEFLSRFDVPIDPARVIVARPPARPLEGLEILPAYQGLLTIPGPAGGIPAGGGPIAPPIVP